MDTNFVIGAIAGAIAVAIIVILIKELWGGSLIELRRDANGNIVEILERGL